MNKDDKPLVFHYVWKYLSLTGIWIYSQIAFLRHYQPVVITRQKENLNLFPVSLIHNLPRCNRPEKIAEVINIFIRRSRFDQLFFLFLGYWYQPEIIHVHFGDSGWEHLFLKRILRKKYIVSFYGYDYNSLYVKNPIWSERYRILFNEGDAFIVEGSKARNTLVSIGCPQEKIFENHLGIDLSKIPFKERKHPGLGKTIRLLQVATFVEKKGHRYTVCAFAKAIKKVPNLSLTFVGTGKLQSEIRRIVHDLGVEAKVEFLPPLPYREVLKLAETHHIFIQPSIHATDGDCEGGAPVILLDMQASGMPVISTYHCDIPEYVIDQITGFLVEERDIDSLAERIIFLSTHAEIWALMGRQGRNHIFQNYNAKTQAEKLEDIYDKILGK